MRFARLLRHGVWSLLSLFLLAIVVFGTVYAYLESQLPDIEKINSTRMEVPLRIYTRDNKLISEFGDHRREPVTLDQIPKQLIQAVLATEDQRYFEHAGVDFFGLMRAGKNLLMTGAKGQGGSTITMQVARNIYLSPEKTYMRKVNEILLAIKIDQTLSKEKILELYFNKIFFGNRAYGIAAAAKVYYGKKLSELTMPEMAMLAGLPKAPSQINPIANKDAALKRRNHVLARMYELNYIDKPSYEAAVKSVDTASYHALTIDVNAPYVAEMVRDALVRNFGTGVYSEGYSVYTTIDSRLQEAANVAVRQGVLDYDHRFGYRGPEHVFKASQDEQQNERNWLSLMQDIPVIANLQPAVVLDVEEKEVTALLASGEKITIPWTGLQWAREYNEKKSTSKLESALDILQEGYLIRVCKDVEGQWQLTQLPEVEGALASLDPHQGAIRALVGGFDYQKSSYNRVTQASRQPGSAFKPFIYAAALAKGFTLASIVNDAPLVIHDTGDDSLWRPQNHNGRYLGPTRLRVGLIKSTNMVSIRLLDSIGLKYMLNFSKNFGFNPDQLPHGLSLSLGSGGVTPLDLTTGYTVFANGGYLVTPHLISSVKNVDDQIIYQSNPKVACEQCIMDDYYSLPSDANNLAPHTVESDIIFIMNTALKDVILEGTAQKAKELNRGDIAGKTGTTNEQHDAWFAGFNGDLVTTAWVGFDQPRDLHEFGAEAALPIWMSFMRDALKDKPEHSMPQPSNVVVARIDPASGLLAWSGQSNAVFEYFRKQDLPSHTAAVSPEVDSNVPSSIINEGAPAAGMAPQDSADGEPLF